MQTRDIKIDDCLHEKLSNLAFLFIRWSYDYSKIAIIETCQKMRDRFIEGTKLTRVELFLFLPFPSPPVPISTKIYDSPRNGFLSRSYRTNSSTSLLVNNFCNGFEEIETSFHFASQRNIFSVFDAKREIKWYFFRLRVEGYTIIIKRRITFIGKYYSVCSKRDRNLKMQTQVSSVVEKIISIFLSRCIRPSCVLIVTEMDWIIRSTLEAIFLFRHNFCVEILHRFDRDELVGREGAVTLEILINSTSTRAGSPWSLYILPSV